jgi:sulfite exporter TauE/SafE
MTYVLAGAALGVAGSVHCAGMCGPLLLAVHRGVPRAQIMRRMALYHSARVFMYALLGIPAGYAAQALSFGVFGRTVAVIAGVLLVAAAAGSFVSRYGDRVSQTWSAAVVRIGAKAAMLTRRHPHSGYIVLGAVNGFLPCGLVYAAVAGAAASGSVATAVTFMIGFGAGTLPLLLAATLSATSVPARVRHRFRFVAPVLMALAGVLLILRAFAPVMPGGHEHEMSVAGSERGRYHSAPLRSPAGVYNLRRG